MPKKIEEEAYNPFAKGDDEPRMLDSPVMLEDDEEFRQGEEESPPDEGSEESSAFDISRLDIATVDVDSVPSEFQPVVRQLQESYKSKIAASDPSEESQEDKRSAITLEAAKLDISEHDIGQPPYETIEDFDVADPNHLQYFLLDTMRKHGGELMLAPAQQQFNPIVQYFLQKMVADEFAVIKREYPPEDGFPDMTTDNAKRLDEYLLEKPHFTLIQAYQNVFKGELEKVKPTGKVKPNSNKEDIKSLSRTLRRKSAIGDSDPDASSTEGTSRRRAAPKSIAEAAAMAEETTGFVLRR